MTHIASELASHIALKEALLREWPDLDEQTLADTLAGATNLEEAIILALRHAQQDEDVVEMLKLQRNRLTDRAKRYEARAERTRAIVANAMEKAELKTIPAPDFTVSLRPTQPKVIVTDVSQLPSDYWTVPDPVVNKKAIKDAIQKGGHVPGATLSNGGMCIQIKAS